MQCDRCDSKHFTKAGRDRQGHQLYRLLGFGALMLVNMLHIVHR
jgi:hypothetical protein